jgi:hypothetical protein
MLSFSRRIFMSDIEYLKEFYGLVKKPKLSTRGELVTDDMLAKIRERNRRERKEKLYSYSPEMSLRRNTLA